MEIYFIADQTREEVALALFIVESGLLSFSYH